MRPIPMLLAAVFAAAPTAHAADTKAYDDAAAVALQWNVKIPMRDGVKLAATVYRPRDAQGALPCVFTLTPYIAQSYHDRGMYFAAHGYVFLTVDARGRGNSEGTFRPLIQEANDGYDTVEWLARQAWCTPKVSMWGGSYAGYDQWATARGRPAHLASIAPVASPYAGVDFPFQHDIFYSYDIQWLTLVAGHASQAGIFGDEAFWASRYADWYRSGKPFRQLDAAVGHPNATFQEWIAHPTRGAYWDAYNPSAADYARMDLPVLTITGQYDGDGLGAFEHYRQHLKNAAAAARAKHFLIIGPWDHAGTRTPKAEVDGLTFGPASLLDMNDLHRQWYDYTLKDGAKPEFLKDRVAYYMIGPEEWRYAATLEAATAGQREYRLDSADGAPNDVFHSGTLSESAPRGAKPDRYVYDPKDSSPAELVRETGLHGNVDQRAVLANGGVGLIYHTAPLGEPLELAGFPSVRTWLSIDQPDTDVAVDLYEIRRDGSSIFIGSDRQRARYRTDLRKANPVPANVPLEYVFDQFVFVGRRLEAGSRVRLVVGPVNSPFVEKNYNDGGVVADGTPANARTVTVSLYHDAEHASALSLPLAAAPAR